MRWLAVVAVVAAVPALARADIYDEQAKVEQPTAVEVSLAGIRARINAKFAFEIKEPGVELDAHSFAIPLGSVVTSGVAIVDGQRHPLQLEQAEAADRAFDALSLKPGTGRNRAWAFMVGGTTGTVTVNLLAPRAAKVVLELTLDAPTCFYNDVRYVALDGWLKRVPAAQKQIVATWLDLGQICPNDEPEPPVPALWLGFASGELARLGAGERRVGAIAGRLALDSTQFARVEIDVARELSAVPADLHTAIVVDHSRSLDAPELEVQRAIVAAYLRAAPASRVQLIGYTRDAQALLPSWMIASHAAPQIDRLLRALPARNGSNLDEALTEASKWLASVRGTKRIVLFSDDRLAERFDDSSDALRKLVPVGTLVHVVQPLIGSGLERHDDERSALVLLAKATQGIAVFGGLDDNARIDATMLVRPITLDDVDVVAPGWERVETLGDDLACEPVLHEGRSCIWWGQGDGGTGPIIITGLLWNTPFKRVVNADPTQARAIARALSVIGMLEEDLQKQVDAVALAVNSVWSLFAQWGGSGGYEDIGGFGTLGLGRFSTSSHTHDVGTTGTGGMIGSLDLRAQLQPGVDRCNARATKVVLDVETTREEIVDVQVELTPANAAVATCISEEAWDTTLGIINPPARARTRVTFAPKR
jgi:hypothetical protein